MVSPVPVVSAAKANGTNPRIKRFNYSLVKCRRLSVIAAPRHGTKASGVGRSELDINKEEVIVKDRP